MCVIKIISHIGFFYAIVQKSELFDFHKNKFENLLMYTKI